MRDLGLCIQSWGRHSRAGLASAKAGRHANAGPQNVDKEQGPRLDSSMGLNVLLTLLSGELASSLEVAQVGALFPCLPRTTGVGQWLCLSLRFWGAENSGFGIANPGSQPAAPNSALAV